MAEIYKALKSAAAGLEGDGAKPFSPAITLQYPDERLDVPVGYRGIPVLLSDAEGNLKCVSCELCARACPVQLHRDPVPREAGPEAKVLDVYNLDATWCMYCGLCVEACPFDALAMSDQFELADYDLTNLVYDRTAWPRSAGAR